MRSGAPCYLHLVEFDVGELLASMLVSGVGFVFFSYGRKMGRAPQILVGLILMVFPYFVSSLLPMLAIALALIGLLLLAIRVGH